MNKSKLFTLPSPILAFTITACMLHCGKSGSPAPIAAATAPTITTQPASQTVATPAAATFLVAVTGTAPFTYQWHQGGQAIAGATSTSYTTPATTLAMSGQSLTVTVTNAGGSVTSDSAILIVDAAAAAITTQPGTRPSRPRPPRPSASRPWAIPRPPINGI